MALVRVGPVRIAISALAPFRPPGWGSVGCRTFSELNLSGALDARHYLSDVRTIAGGLCQVGGTTLTCSNAMPDLPPMAFPIVNGMRSIQFGTPGSSRAQLVSLVLDGTKRATAGTLEWDYVAEGEPIEHVGERLAVLGDDDRHVATIQVTKIEIRRFADVPDEFALAEGEGDLSGDDFRASHRGYWSKLGLPINDSTDIVLMYFELVEKK